MVKNEWGVVTVDLGIKAWGVAGMLIEHRSGNFMERAETMQQQKQQITL